MDPDELTVSELRAHFYAEQESLKLDQSFEELKKKMDDLYSIMEQNEKSRRTREEFYDGTKH
jgi:hypothetical protein